MRAPIVAAFCATSFLREGDGSFRHRCFADPAAAREHLHRVPVTIARREIHLRINPRRLSPERLLDPAQPFDEILPIDRAERAQTGDAVAHRDLVGRLVLAFLVDQLFDRKALLHELLLQPAAREMEHRVQAGETLAKFRDERAREPEIGPRHIRDHDDDARRIVFRHFLQLLDPFVRFIAVEPALGQPAGHPLEIFNQAEPKHDGHGPEFADFQRRNRLVGGDETCERRGIDLRIDVRDELEHDLVDPELAGGISVLQAG